ncbi:type IX secretion system sortase PorU [Dyadobacter sp. CY107]|uniref:type IX secretion system sortase PorU n=1 Tax=Dyadobacter fanqingshengii TaxID=2906443 RepID=UPI001F452BD3|nr:type IX secretion system sortase PorU [Dyadobacter fanqingshengii]MCF2503697.1 type IX secretion system sortase PorU [Dyadobacter fanqingshengii]
MHWLKHVNFPIRLIRTAFCCLGIIISFSLKAQEKSVLSTGNWYKLAVSQTGIHRIDFSFFRKLGVNPADIDPRQIRIYSQRSGMLPQPNNALKSNALAENAIMVYGEEDGKFDGNDAVFFYAEGPHEISFDSVKSELRHQINIYTDSSYYFLTYGQQIGLRVKPLATITSQKAHLINQFDDYWFHEAETYNLLKSGREWWGEYLINAPLSFTASIPGIVPASKLKLRTSAIGAAQIATKFLWQLNGRQAGEASIGTVSAGTYDIKALRADATFTINADSSPPDAITVGVAYERNGQSSAQGYLNYVAMHVRRQLRQYANQQVYRFLPESSDTVTYQFSNASSDWLLWNVSSAQIPAFVNQNIQNGTSSFTTIGGKGSRHYIGFKTDQAIEPFFSQRVDPQNIVSNAAPDLLIVTPAAWKQEAERLAAFRESNDGLETLVVTMDEIYNEFGGGKPDLTAIRDFAKHLYMKEPGKLKYLLLFGDASFDYKNNLKNQSAFQQKSWVPVYESRESLNPVYTYSSDDYFGFMKDSEGAWTESVAGDHTVDIGVGRLPVKSLSEAQLIVDKLIRYGSSGRVLGNWRNNVQFVADDGDGNIHQRHADELASLIQLGFMSSRVFIDAFPQNTGLEGQKAPAVNQIINKKINEGTLILNYTGHGGVSGWAEEQVLTLADMQSARGMDNLPLLFTATCDFGRYDDMGLVSGAELMVLSPRGAAIGAISTTRPVYSSTNFTLSKAFYEALLKEGPHIRLGDIFKETKNNALVGSLNRNFTLLADPSMQLARARKSIRWAEKPDTLRALQKVQLKGQIFDAVTALKDNKFDGVARVVLYDKQITFKTLGNEGRPETYSEFRSKLFDGRVKVKGGEFICEFVMPKDIDYRVGIGRANVYAVQADSLGDASGQLGVTIGGSAVPETDNTPPKLTAYMNDASFRDGDLIEPSATLYVMASDENGISISNAGIGHNITLEINDTTTITLNDYYTADTDDYRKGVITYPFENLPTGKYLIRVKVWDTYTNFSEIAFGFQVGAFKGIQLNALKVYPNPFDKDLSFELAHNRVNEDVEIVFNIFLNNGQSLGQFRRQYFNTEATVRETFDVTQSGFWIPNLTSLVYQLSIRSLKDNSRDQRSGKLIRSP